MSDRYAFYWCGRCRRHDSDSDGDLSAVLLCAECFEAIGRAWQERAMAPELPPTECPRCGDKGSTNSLSCLMCDQA